MLYHLTPKVATELSELAELYLKQFVQTCIDMVGKLFDCLIIIKTFNVGRRQLKFLETEAFDVKSILYNQVLKADISD